MFIGRKIQGLRMCKGMSQITLAKMADVTPQMISDYECDRHVPKQLTLERIALALDTTTDYFNSIKRM